MEKKNKFAPYYETSSKCSDTCFVTTDQKYAEEADAFIIHGRDYKEPPPKFSKKPWIYHCRENPAYTPINRDDGIMSKFTYSSTARLDSDFPFPSWKGVGGTQGRGPDTSIATVSFHERRKVPVYAANSNCEPVRTEYQRQLMRYIEVDSYGACLKNKNGLITRYKPEFMQKNNELMAQYKFTLVFMNADCDLWVDTRLLYALDAGTVPVFMGTEDVYRFLPGMTDAIIKVSDFASPQELAAYLIKVAANKTLFNAYLSWKHRTVNYTGTEMQSVQENMGNWYCNICDAVRKNPVARRGRVKADKCLMRKMSDWLPTPKHYKPKPPMERMFSSHSTLEHTRTRADEENKQTLFINNDPVRLSKNSATGSLFQGDKIRNYRHSMTHSSPQKTTKSNSSSATGTLFYGERIRNYLEAIMQVSTRRRLLTIKNDSKCFSQNWAVLTTINSETEAVRKAAGLRGWCVVVVADRIGPKTYTERDNVVFLHENDQRFMEKTSSFVAKLPWRHFGRKNVGYLYAITQGAEIIFDFDDDNELIKNPLSMMKPKHLCTPDRSFLSFNPYSALNSSVSAPWPRGLPLEEYHNQKISRACFSENNFSHKAAIYQSAANHDPDVDAVYRLTREIPFDFENDSKAIEVPLRVFVPYNAQANIHTRAAMWALFLPVTVEGRVSDIWRGYISQRLMWDQGLGLIYTSPVVQQQRNAHNYLADFQAEQDLYHRSGVLLRFLKSWTCTKGMPSCMITLWIDLYERGYIELLDVELVKDWITELQKLGYVFEKYGT